jgi:hypothetical protein
MILRPGQLPDGMEASTVSPVNAPVARSLSIELMQQAYQDKLAAMALVRDLLKRKELLVNAMRKMNAQARILRHDFKSNNCVANNTSSDETLFQRQYAWLVVNLDVTNRYLRAALLRLQDVTSAPKVCRSWPLLFDKELTSCMVDRVNRSSYYTAK